MQDGKLLFSGIVKLALLKPPTGAHMTDTSEMVSVVSTIMSIRKIGDPKSYDDEMPYFGDGRHCKWSLRSRRPLR